MRSTGADDHHDGNIELYLINNLFIVGNEFKIAISNNVLWM